MEEGTDRIIIRGYGDVRQHVWLWDDGIGCWIWRRNDGGEVYLHSTRQDTIRQMCAIVGVDALQSLVTAWVDEQDWLYDTRTRTWSAYTWDGWCVEALMYNESTVLHAECCGEVELVIDAKPLYDTLIDATRWARTLWTGRIERNGVTWEWDDEEDGYIAWMYDRMITVYWSRSSTWRYQVSGEHARETQRTRPQDAIEIAMQHMEATYGKQIA